MCQPIDIYNQRRNRVIPEFQRQIGSFRYSIEECFTNHDTTLANRPKTITSDHFSYGYKNFGFAPYGDLWRTLRRLSTLEVFSSVSLQKNAYIRNEEVSNLCSNLFRLSRDSRRVDLKYQFTLLTAHVMFRLVSGNRGVEESDPESEKRFLDDFKLRFFSSMSMNVCDYFPVLRWIGYKGLEKRVIEMQRMRDEYLQRLIDDIRMKKFDSTGSIVEKFLKLQESEPEFYADDVIKGIVVLMFNGGTDTSPVAMEWAMDGELWEEADVFKPERFEGFAGDRDGFRFLPFGVGRRACPAAGLGMRVVALAVGTLVQCFEWEKVEEGDIDMRPVFGVAMAKAEPLVALSKPWPEMVPILSQL
ncbi:unnamed protein product [Arabidopsis arenosa]|uniref:Cytochrome P450 n=1 Tax=Arabidopsis arenosa TaxID=38785 RepID=A0A8S2AJC9_ARAAE|nr:unnamed protein product [Arabidopsis arenosa]